MTLCCAPAAPPRTLCLKSTDETEKRPKFAPASFFSFAHLASRPTFLGVFILASVTCASNFFSCSAFVPAAVASQTFCRNPSSFPFDSHPTHATRTNFSLGKKPDALQGRVEVFKLYLFQRANLLPRLFLAYLSQEREREVHLLRLCKRSVEFEAPYFLLQFGEFLLGGFVKFYGAKTPHSSTRFERFLSKTKLKHS